MSQTEMTAREVAEDTAEVSRPLIFAKIREASEKGLFRVKVDGEMVNQEIRKELKSAGFEIQTSGIDFKDCWISWA
jgi:hypothetical protein